MKLVTINPALKNLLDEPLMIGRHRPLIGQWVQKWVDEYEMTEKVEEGVDAEVIANKMKMELIKEIENGGFSVNVEKVCLNEGWRKGTPLPPNPKMGREVTVKFFGFRNTPREVDVLNGSFVPR